MDNELEKRRKTTLRELEIARGELLKRSEGPRSLAELHATTGILYITELAIAVLESDEQHFPKWFLQVVLSILHPWTGSKYRKLLTIQEKLEEVGENALPIDEEQ